jgi:hypothetical protein
MELCRPSFLARASIGACGLPNPWSYAMQYGFAEVGAEVMIFHSRLNAIHPKDYGGQVRIADHEYVARVRSAG